MSATEELPGQQLPLHADVSLARCRCHPPTSPSSPAGRPAQRSRRPRVNEGEAHVIRNAGGTRSAGSSQRCHRQAQRGQLAVWQALPDRATTIASRTLWMVAGIAERVPFALVRLDAAGQQLAPGRRERRRCARSASDGRVRTATAADNCAEPSPVTSTMSADRLWMTGSRDRCGPRVRRQRAGLPSSRQNRAFSRWAVMHKPACRINPKPSRMVR